MLLKMAKHRKNSSNFTPLGEGLWADADRLYNLA
jgi:hypothetical protein